MIIMGAYRALIDLYKEGKIRAIGISNFYPDRLVDLVIYNKVKPAVNQIEVNPFHQQNEAQYYHQKYNIQMQAWAPFAQGRGYVFTHPQLQAIGQKYRKTNAQVILRWLVQRRIVPLAKTVNKERMKENIDIFDFELSYEDMEIIESMDQNKSCFFDHYNPATVEMIAGLR